MALDVDVTVLVDKLSDKSKPHRRIRGVLAILLLIAALLSVVAETLNSVTTIQSSLAPAAVTHSTVSVADLTATWPAPVQEAIEATLTAQAKALHSPSH